MMKQAMNMLFRLTATKLKMLPTTLSTKARTASPAKKMRISASKLKNRKTAFIARSF
jgi:hypothetical protein